MAKKVLVVDDEQDMRVFITTMLETSGFKVIVARDGPEGLKTARSRKPALIIMDIMMPKESGIYLYREVKKDPDLRRIPVIMLSALSRKTYSHSQQVMDRYEGIQVPEPAAYIEKPPDPGELLDTVRRLLG